jgi:hypothetical protein
MPMFGFSSLTSALASSNWGHFFSGNEKPAGWAGFLSQFSFLGLFDAISFGRNCRASLSRFRKCSIDGEEAIRRESAF